MRVVPGPDVVLIRHQDKSRIELCPDAKPWLFHDDSDPQLPKWQASGETAFFLKDFFDDEGNRLRADRIFLEEHHAAE